MTIELNAWTLILFGLGMLFLSVSALAALGITKSTGFLPGSPMSLALAGASSVLMPIGNALANSDMGGVAYVFAFFPLTLLMAAAILERRERDRPSHNKSLQQTPDPASVSAVTESSTASSAAEHQR